jgi:hypothetical protein
MEHRQKGVPDSSRTLASVMNGEDSRQPIHRRPSSLTIRVREIDCMLADIQAHMQILRREKTHLGLVRKELAAGMAAKRRGLSRGKSLLMK